MSIYHINRSKFQELKHDYDYDDDDNHDIVGIMESRVSFLMGYYELQQPIRSKVSGGKQEFVVFHNAPKSLTDHKIASKKRI